MSKDVFALAVGGHIPTAFDGHLRDFCIHLDDAEAAYLNDLHELLYRSTQSGVVSPQTLLQIIGAFLWHVDYLWNIHAPEQRQALSPQQRVFADFMQLLSQYAAIEHQIEFYASRLCLTPRYMSTIIKQVSGKAAKQWIDDALVTRISVALRHSDRTIQQISDDMNFANASFFSKYFKRITGLTPGQYRRGREPVSSFVKPDLCDIP